MSRISSNVPDSILGCDEIFKAFIEPVNISTRVEIGRKLNLTLNFEKQYNNFHFCFAYKIHIFVQASSCSSILSISRYVMIFFVFEIGKSQSESNSIFLCT